MLKRLILLCLGWLAWCGMGQAWALGPAGQGVVESVAVEQASGALVVRGWVVSSESNVFPTEASVALGDRVVYRGRLGIMPGTRPDVVAATGNIDWLNSGFELRMWLDPDMHAGDYAVHMTVRTTNGGLIPLQTLETARRIHVDMPLRASLRSRVLALLALLVPLGCFAVSFGAFRSRWLRAAGSLWGVAGGVALAFALLVAGGWTGSSISLLLRGDALVAHDERPWLGAPQPTRADEWLVITALAVSQFNGARAGHGFPDVSQVLTADGHNMNVVGMSGVPVANAAAWAKPATWGFFVFDLRRALAWYWWVPFFACFAAAWWVMACVLAVRWQWAAVLALLLSVSPFSVGWSGWPSYLMFFALWGWGMLLTGWTARSRWRALAAGLLAGWAGAGLVLTLYPAWTVVLLTLLGPLAVAWLYERRGQWRWTMGPGWVLLGAFLAAGLLLGDWWWHSHDAVAAIRATEYPGLRAETGGYLDAWHLVKGLLGPVYMFSTNSMQVPSDAGSFIWLLLPLAVLLLWRQWRERKVDWVANAGLLYVVWVLWFGIVGVPAWLARWTGWSMVPAYRVDIGLGLAQALLWAHALRPGRDGAERLPMVAAGLVCAVAAAGAAYGFGKLPPAITEQVPSSLVLLAGAGFVALTWAWVNGRQRMALVLYGVWMLAAALPFNPLLQAPSEVAASPDLRTLWGAQAQQPPRVAVLTGPRRGLELAGHRQALALAAAGVPISSGVFYAPPLAFWHALDPEGKNLRVYNRYQHLILESAELPLGQDFEAALPRLDLVLLRLDAARFDFARLGADVVLATPQDVLALQKNPHLQALAPVGGWSAFRVTR